MSRRQFYRTVLKIEILSPEPVDFDRLRDVDHAITFGKCRGGITHEIENEVIDGPTMARLTQEHGYDPEFFQLTDTGDDEDEES